MSEFFYGDDFTEPEPSRPETLSERLWTKLTVLTVPENGRGVGRLRRPVIFLGRIDWILFICVLAGVSGFYHWYSNRLPPLRTKHHVKDISETRIRSYLFEGTKDGEVDLSLFLDKLNLIASVTDGAYANTFDMFIHNTGSCIGTNEECLRRSGNIAVHFGTKYHRSENVFLVGCDFSLKKQDFTERSPFPCALLLEVMQALVFSNYTVANDILFSFNIVGKNYSDEPYLHLLNYFNVTSFIKLAGGFGREVLLPTDGAPLLTAYLDSAQYAPMNVLTTLLLHQNRTLPQLNSKRSQRPEPFRNLLGLEIFYTTNGDSFEKQLRTQIGSIQRAGANLLRFLKLLIRAPRLRQEELRLWKWTFPVIAENYGLLKLRFSTYPCPEFPRLILFYLPLVVVFAVSFGVIHLQCKRRNLCSQTLLRWYVMGCGMIIGINLCLYFVSGIFNLIPITWTPGLKFLRNLFLHTLVTLSTFFKFAEATDPKRSIDYENIFYLHGIVLTFLGLSYMLFINCSYEFGYLFALSTVPFLFNLPIVRCLLFGFGVAHSSPRAIMFLQLLCMLPATICTTEFISSYYRCSFTVGDSNLAFVAAVTGPIFVISMSNLVWVSQNIIMDWGVSTYIPLRDSPWMSINADFQDDVKIVTKADLV